MHINGRVFKNHKERSLQDVADCDDCSHCVDLYTPLPSDPIELKKIRDEQYLTIQE